MRQHRTPARVLVGGGFAGTLTAAAALVAGATPALAGAADDLAALRGCESGGNYAAATGNGYYGAYQFDQATWAGLGLAGLPSQAAPEIQDAAALSLTSRSGGWSPWPACAASLGLGAVPSAAAPVAIAAAPVRSDPSRRTSSQRPRPRRPQPQPPPRGCSRWPPPPRRTLPSRRGSSGWPTGAGR